MHTVKKRGIRYWWDYLGHLLKIRRELPGELAEQFEVYKDIKSIDRIGIGAWIGFALTICLFGLDYYRYCNGILSFQDNDHSNPYFRYLFYFHLTGLLMFIPALHVSMHKKWIKETRLRRGIVIWSMVLLAFVFVYGQSVVVFLYRQTGVLFLGFVFTATWMFSMAHKERLLFIAVTSGVMISIIATHTDIVEFSIKNQLVHDTVHDKIITNFIEIFFLSIVAFAFDAFDYNQKLTNFLNNLMIDQEQKRISQLEEFKNRFFTNLTHEFRTPLTTIIGMAKEIATNPTRWHQEGTQMIRQNAENLLKLVNQVLDVSKIESGTMSLHLVQGDIVSFLNYTIDSFKGYAVNKKIGLHFICSEDEVVMDYDPEKFTAIISNLLSNAIKFSPENENVYISLGIHKEGEKEHLEISVKDNGIGIPREQLDLIFERFYQVDNEMSASGIGTGVGLSLVRELVHLLNGKIEVTSSLGKGTKFTVTLPIHHSAPMSDELFNVHLQLTQSGDDHKPALWSAEKLAGEKGNGKPEILVIEDNQDVIRYIQICLQDQYHVIMSKNGAEGVDMAIRNVPDLILSDVLMPVKDGLTACKELKHNPATSHIPIILLSAKTDPASRIAGLESGADVYMIKPFEKEELRLQIRKLLARFEEFHARYAGDSPVPLAAPEPAHEMEDEFITRIRNLVQAHLDDTEFSVNDLERGVFLSRSQLHKKLKALTGLSAMQYVSRIRLSAAREKLKSGDHSISDIAYEVGYSDPNYFSRAYSDEYGESPSETRKKLKNNTL